MCDICSSKSVWLSYPESDPQVVLVLPPGLVVLSMEVNSLPPLSTEELALLEKQQQKMQWQFADSLQSRSSNNKQEE